MTIEKCEVVGFKERWRTGASKLECIKMNVRQILGAVPAACIVTGLMQIRDAFSDRVNVNVEARFFRVLRGIGEIFWIGGVFALLLDIGKTISRFFPIQFNMAKFNLCHSTLFQKFKVQEAPQLSAQENIKFGGFLGQTFQKGGRWKCSLEGDECRELNEKFNLGLALHRGRDLAWREAHYVWHIPNGVEKCVVLVDATDFDNPTPITLNGSYVFWNIKAN